jgi:hypothetical protein
VTTKNDIIQDAYQEVRISGLTINPRPSDEVLALNRLEMFMSEMLKAKNMKFGYNFETNPDVNSPTGVDLSLKPFMVYNLAVRLIPAFNKQVPQQLMMLARSSASSASAISARQNTRQVQPSTRMPVGSGNRFRDLYGSRYSIPESQAPVSWATNNIEVGETQDYEEDFEAWLEGNTIASFTIAVDPRLTVDSSSNTNTRVEYTVTATGNKAASPELQYLKLTVTDSAGRVQIRLINFEVTTLPEVP